MIESTRDERLHSAGVTPSLWRGRLLAVLALLASVTTAVFFDSAYYRTQQLSNGMMPPPFVTYFWLSVVGHGLVGLLLVLLAWHLLRQVRVDRVTAVLFMALGLTLLIIATPSAVSTLGAWDILPLFLRNALVGSITGLGLLSHCAAFAFAMGIVQLGRSMRQGTKGVSHQITSS